jgi:hypothetical protein
MSNLRFNCRLLNYRQVSKKEKEKRHSRTLHTSAVSSAPAGHDTFISTLMASFASVPKTLRPSLVPSSLASANFSCHTKHRSQHDNNLIARSQASSTYLTKLSMCNFFLFLKAKWAPPVLNNPSHHPFHFTMRVQENSRPTSRDSRTERLEPTAFCCLANSKKPSGATEIKLSFADENLEQ